VTSLVDSSRLFSANALGSRVSSGNSAEAAAVDYLKARGLKVLARNHREKFGELDIVMADGNCVVFVEVRYRASRRWGGALASVNPPKQRRLIKAAQSYLEKHPGLKSCPCRFDVVAVEGDLENAEIRWVRRAFGT
jgi:putative endonuclease